ncbi:hypothetical protein CAOG_07375 [Capsaspora owczarzaki ATCC 30864]|uniref:Small ribosomal subunit protein uS10m n=1 Tax=Capsaspora owczarzaki (strain ATCC 30864) TaxID=595528 RepID=A0A0D2WWV7_CAPO3|nr:hypothetical protein CAOG_07375 [Capsaspora owczarzaki ATCC 30864]KJE97535.1 hypothetical protein CAOG_007375 [Capsaspora owczarzaki ATCC 30864]|eukprot:XP_004343234.1 hypothetical protein CAOG_07375 [Capsaspora owczarzaki ATCC 30864]
MLAAVVVRRPTTAAQCYSTLLSSPQQLIRRAAVAADAASVTVAVMAGRSGLAASPCGRRAISGFAPGSSARAPTDQPPAASASSSSSEASYGGASGRKSRRGGIRKLTSAEFVRQLTGQPEPRHQEDALLQQVDAFGGQVTKALKQLAEEPGKTHQRMSRLRLEKQQQDVLASERALHAQQVADESGRSVYRRAEQIELRGALDRARASVTKPRFVRNLATPGPTNTIVLPAGMDMAEGVESPAEPEFESFKPREEDALAYEQNRRKHLDERMTADQAWNRAYLKARENEQILSSELVSKSPAPSATALDKDKFDALTQKRAYLAAGAGTKIVAIEEASGDSGIEAAATAAAADAVAAFTKKLGGANDVHAVADHVAAAFGDNASSTVDSSSSTTTTTTTSVVEDEDDGADPLDAVNMMQVDDPHLLKLVNEISRMRQLYAEKLPNRNHEAAGEAQLLPAITISLKGYDWSVLESYASFISMFGDFAGATTTGVLLYPTHTKRFVVLKSPHINKKHRDIFVRNTHHRGVRISNLNEDTLQKFLQIVEREIPAGIEMRVDQFSYEELRFSPRDWRDKYEALVQSSAAN